MTFTSRRKPLTLVFCCSLAGTAAATFVGQVQAQTAAPFRVDPGLLGLPPLQAVRPPLAAPVEQPAAGERAVAVPAADSQPTPTAAGITTPAATPVAAPPAAAAAREPLPAEAAPAVEKRPASTPMAVPAPAQAASGVENVSPASVASPPVPAPVETRPLPAPPAASASAETTPAVAPAVDQRPLQRPVAEALPVPAPSEPAVLPRASERVEPVLATPAEAAAPVVPAPAVQGASAPVQLQPPAESGTPPVVTPLATPLSAVKATEGSAAEPMHRSAARSPSASPSAALGGEHETSPRLPLPLRMAKAMVPPPKEGDVPRPAFLSAQRISGVIDRELLAEEDAELRKVGTVLTGDRLTYWPANDEVEAVGHARLEQGEDYIAGPRMRLKIEEQVGFVDQASYFMKRQPGAVAATPGDASSESLPGGQPGDEWTSGFAAPRTIKITPGQTVVKAKGPVGLVSEGRGDAERIDLEGENQYRLTAATYTTCKPGNDDWYLSAAELKLDYDNEVGSGDDATVRFFGVPIFHSPWVSFSLSDERKSGFLTPSYGATSDSGLVFTVPYYWNIAPNMDATISPRILTRRGLQVGTDFRYVNAAYGGSYRGDALVEILPHDRETNSDRWGVSLIHTQTLANGFSGAVNYSRVSDNNYYTDLSSQITSTAKTQLLEQGTLTYGGGGWWSATANVQSYQTLQPDPQNPVAQPYRMLPQITVNARQPDLYLTDSAFFGQYTNFVSAGATKVAGQVVIPSQVEGQRTVLQPQVSLPYVTPGWYVIPRLGANVTQYALSRPSSASVLPDSINRSLPIFSVDSGMTFERPSNWFGRDYTQTLEPRLFYLNIPYKNQNDIPIFDTALADFNFAQIFADNRYSGWDRINNANQLTAALSSRLIDPSSGSEIMRAMFGQVFYFSQNKVLLPAAIGNPEWATSNYLAAFSGQILPRLYVDTAMEYDPNNQQFQRFGFGAHYVPAAGKVLNASYSYNPDAATPIKQVDFSGQWPINGRWQAVGRYNYSFLQNVPVEIIGGLEYNAGCWALRALAHRIQTTQADSNTQFFVQLELNGLTRVGSNPLSLIQRRIPGYATSQPVTDPALAEQ